MIAMGFALLLLAGAATVTVPAAGDTGGCATADPDEIVVCKRTVDPGRYRPPLPPPGAAGPPRAEWGLGGGVRAGIETSSVPMPQGAISQRAMVTLKLPF